MENEIYIQQTRRSGEGGWRRVGFYHQRLTAEEDMARRARKNPESEFRLVEYAETGRVILPEDLKTHKNRRI